MDAAFWPRLHGGSTHFPIVLLLVSVVFDAIAWRSRDAALRRGLHAAGLGSPVVGVLGACVAVTAGLAMTRGQMLGSGLEKLHHLFVWPAFGLSVALVVWRLSRRGRLSPRAFGLYLAGMSLASALVMGAGFWGGEMLLSGEAPDHPALPPSSAEQVAMVAGGQKLFARNCAHCHAADATGDEGPDLHGVRKSDARIKAIITNGIKGEMPRFGQKLHDEDVQQLIYFLHSLMRDRAA